MELSGQTCVEHLSVDIYILGCRALIEESWREKSRINGKLPKCTSGGEDWLYNPSPMHPYFVRLSRISRHFYEGHSMGCSFGKVTTTSNKSKFIAISSL
jgi:hypothetical protein